MKLNTEQLNKLHAFVPSNFLAAAAKAHLLVYLSINKNTEPNNSEAILSTFYTAISLYAQAIVEQKPDSEQEHRVYHYIVDIISGFSQLIRRFNDNSVSGGLYQIFSETLNEEDNEVRLYLRGAAEMLVVSL